VVLNERYDLSTARPPALQWTATKPVQEGVRVKLTAGTTWEGLAGMTPDQIRDGNLFPPGFLPLPHPKHQEGGMVFPRFLINEIKRQEGRDLTRFDVDFDIPDHFLPEFQPAIYLNQRSDLSTIAGRLLPPVQNSPTRPERQRAETRSCCCRCLARNRRGDRRYSRLACASASDNIAQSFQETSVSDGRERLLSSRRGIPSRLVNANPNTSSSISVGWTRNASAISSLLTPSARSAANTFCST
jgi:hypothetical protein